LTDADYITCCKCSRGFSKDVYWYDYGYSVEIDGKLVYTCPICGVEEDMLKYEILEKNKLVDDYITCCKCNRKFKREILIYDRGYWRDSNGEYVCTICETIEMSEDFIVKEAGKSPLDLLIGRTIVSAATDKFDFTEDKFDTVLYLTLDNGEIVRVQVLPLFDPLLDISVVNDEDLK